MSVPHPPLPYRDDVERIQPDEADDVRRRIDSLLRSQGSTPIGR